jgi:hypothetical protein
MTTLRPRVEKKEAVLQFVTVGAIPGLVAGVRKCFASGKTRPLEFREQQLQALLRLLHELLSLQFRQILEEERWRQRWMFGDL